MTSPLATHAATPLDLAPLIDAAQAQTTLSGLANVLKLLAEAVGAYSCILWRGEEFESDHLFALAQWAPENQKTDLYYLPRNSTVTGEAVASGRTRNVPDLKQTNFFVNSDDTFFERANI